MSKYALLLRLNPVVWTTWERDVPEGQNSKVWFKTGRLRVEDFHPGIPVVVLGTGGLGVVAFGETVTGVEFLPDPDWQDVAPESQHEYRQPENRIQVKMSRASVQLADLQSQPLVATLHNRRLTTTWLDSEQYDTLMSLIKAKPAS